MIGCAFESVATNGEVQRINSNGQEAFMTLFGGAIKYRYDGGDPTPTDGHLVTDGQSFRIKDKRNLESFRFISASNIPGVLSITYEQP